MPATGGTDNFSDVWLDPPPGSDRTFAHLRGPLTLTNWMDAIKRGRTFFSTGRSLASRSRAASRAKRSRSPPSAPADVRVVADVVSIAPLDSLEILVNGEVAQTVRADRSAHVAFDGTVAVPLGRLGRRCARSGPKSKYLGDDYAFAQTSPVYVVRGGRRFSRPTDVQFLPETVDAIWTRVERSRWRSDAERDAFRAAVDRAQAVYSKLAAEAAARP